MRGKTRLMVGLGVWYCALAAPAASADCTYTYEDGFSTPKAQVDSYSHSPFWPGMDPPPPGSSYLFYTSVVQPPGALGFSDSGACLAYCFPLEPSPLPVLPGGMEFDVYDLGGGYLSFSKSSDDVHWTLPMPLGFGHQRVTLFYSAQGTSYVRLCGHDVAIDNLQVSLVIESASGDFDCDGDVDLDDYALCVDCMAGPASGVLPGCDATDLDHDNDVDLADFQIFQAAFNPPASPRIAEYSNSGCLDPDAPSDHAKQDNGMAADDEYPYCGDDIIEATVVGDTLHVVHRNAVYNCCPEDIRVSLSVAGNVLTLTEQEIGGVCLCLCCYEVESTVVNLSPGLYLLEYCFYDYRHGDVCLIQEIVVPSP